MKVNWIKYVLIVLLLEKAVQHIFVSLAFYFDWGGIRSTVTVNPNVLLVLGAMVAALFSLSLYGAISQKKWAFNLAMGLALFDVVGEFVAQGTLIIKVTVSFLTALSLLALTISYQRHGLQSRRIVF